MFRRAFQVLWRSIRRFFDDSAFQLAAALSYYSLLSMAPLILIVVAIVGLFFSNGRVEDQLVGQMQSLIGDAGAELTQTVIDRTGSPERSAWQLVVGAVLTLVGATTVFAQLQHALNRVWRVEAKPGNAIGTFIRQRILSFALVLSIGFLLMVSLFISALLSSLHGILDERFEAAAIFWQLLDIAISFGVATLMIGLMFKYLPDARIEWRDTWHGAMVTGALFIVGKYLIGLYLGQTTVASSFGAAGSVVVFMIWVYYAALILLFGAEITQAVAEGRGRAAGTGRASIVARETTGGSGDGTANGRQTA